jgi:hypothetical protein
LASSISFGKNPKRDIDASSSSSSSSLNQVNLMDCYGSPQSSLSFSDPKAFDDLSALIVKNSGSRSAAKTSAVEASIPIHLSRAIGELDALAGRYSSLFSSSCYYFEVYFLGWGFVLMNLFAHFLFNFYNYEIAC